MTEPVSIQVVSDFVCPWCYVGKKRMEKALAGSGTDAAVVWLPFQLSPDMPPEGKNRKEHYDSIFGAERAATIMSSMEDTGREEGIEFTYTDDAMSPNTLKAHALVHYAQMTQDQTGVDVDALVEALFHAHHVECRDIGDVDVLLDLAAKAGLDADAVRACLDSGEETEAVNQMMEQIRSQQVSGVPFFVLGGQLGLSGAQPADVFAQALEQLNESA